MTTATVNISFPKRLLRAMDHLARQEDRSRSELLREAARLYIDRQQRWEKLFAFGRRQARRLHLTPEDVNTLIAEHRRSSKTHG